MLNERVYIFSITVCGEKRKTEADDRKAIWTGGGSEHYEKDCEEGERSNISY